MKKELFVPSSIQKLPTESHFFSEFTIEIIVIHSLDIPDSPTLKQAGDELGTGLKFPIYLNWWMEEEGKSLERERGECREPVKLIKDWCLVGLLAFSRKSGTLTNTILSFHALGLSLLQHFPNCVGDGHKGQLCV